MGYDDMIFQWILSLAIFTISTFFCSIIFHCFKTISSLLPFYREMRFTPIIKSSFVAPMIPHFSKFDGPVRLWHHAIVYAVSSVTFYDCWISEMTPHNLTTDSLHHTIFSTHIYQIFNSIILSDVIWYIYWYLLWEWLELELELESIVSYLDWNGIDWMFGLFLGSY